MGQQANLRIRVLGVLAVDVDGREVPSQELASRKGRTLLKLLLARRGEVAPADVLVEALWAGRPPADPDAKLATLVSRLRAVLGPEVIAGDRHGWRFVAGARVEVDLEEAERLAVEAEARLAGQPALALAAAERALAHAEAATAADPLDESAWRAVMLAHASAGEPAAALAAYERLRQALAEELGTDPSTETRTIHLSSTAATRRPPPTPRPRAQPAATRPRARAPGGSVAEPQGARPRLSTAPADAELVGREVELAGLTRAWEAAVARRPGLVLVVGEAGIGKTRLVGALAELAGATGESAGTLAELVPELRRLLDLPAYERAPPELGPGQRRPTPSTSRGDQGRASGGRAATAAMASRRMAAGSSTRPATPTVASR